MARNIEKRQKFVRLAESRTQNALNAIRKIGNLSNQRAYEFDETDVKKIVKALRDATNEVERRFSSASGEQSDTFRL